MVKISLPYIYDLAKNLHPLRSIVVQGSQLTGSYYALYVAEQAVSEFVSAGSVFSSSLQATAAPGERLRAALSRLTSMDDLEHALTFYEAYSVTSALTEFETVLAAELNVANTYLVSKKRGFDTRDLINSAEVLFPDALAYRVPEAVSDIRNAGRCIAFEMGTAAGFHIMRATELVVRKFWDAVTDGAQRPERFSVADYLGRLDTLNKGDAKTRNTLRQIQNLHRNELIHPEVTLTVDDAIALLGICTSAIIAMLKEIPDPQAVVVATPALPPYTEQLQGLETPV